MAAIFVLAAHRNLAWSVSKVSWCSPAAAQERGSRLDVCWWCIPHLSLPSLIAAEEVDTPAKPPWVGSQSFL